MKKRVFAVLVCLTLVLGLVSITPQQTRAEGEEVDLTINVEKVWEPAGVEHPESVSVTLYHFNSETSTWEAVEGRTLELNESNSWKGTFSLKVPADDLNNYRVQEDNPPGDYRVSVENVEVHHPTDATNTTRTVITNTYKYGHFDIWNRGWSKTELSMFPLLGAEFTIVNANAEPVTLKDGKGPFEQYEAVMVLDMEEDADVTTGDVLPMWLSNGEPAKYFIIETRVPDGYSGRSWYTDMPSPSPWEQHPRRYNAIQPFAADQGSPYMYYDYNKPKEPVFPNYQDGGIKIYKTDAADPSKKLEGVTFQVIFRGSKSGIITSNLPPLFTDSYVMVNGVKKGYDEVVAEITTDANGYAETGCILPLQDSRGFTAEYVLREVNPPDGYLRGSDTTVLLYQHQLIEEADYQYPVEIKNSKIPLTGIRIVKTDEADDTRRLQGAEFKIYPDTGYSVRLNGTTYTDADPIMTLTTDEKGEASTGIVLPLQTEDGTPMPYRIVETKAPKGYEMLTREDCVLRWREGEGLEANKEYELVWENAKEPETTEVSVKKIWNDTFMGVENFAGKRPGYVSIDLLANGEKADTLLLNEENGFAGTFTDLPVTGDDGKEITYTIEEDAVPAYITRITGDAKSGFTVTNINRPWTEVQGESDAAIMGEFTFEKTVSGAAEKDKSYDLLVTMKFENGETHEQKIKFKPGDKPILFDYVPAGTEITVTEKTTGYDMTCTVDKKKTATFTVSADAPSTVVADNYKAPPLTPTNKKTAPKTGDMGQAGLWSLMLLTSLAFVWGLARRKKRV